MKSEKKIVNLYKPFFLDLLRPKRKLHQYLELGYVESEDGSRIGFPELMPYDPSEVENSRTNERY
jgi:hypothetical protein